MFTFPCEFCLDSCLVTACCSRASWLFSLVSRLRLNLCMYLIDVCIIFLMCLYLEQSPLAPVILPSLLFFVCQASNLCHNPVLILSCFLTLSLPRPWCSGGFFASFDHSMFWPVFVSRFELHSCAQKFAHPERNC